MVIEDRIIRSARNTVNEALSQFQRRAALENHLPNNLLCEIMDTLCNFYDGMSRLVFRLPLEDREEVLYALARRGIHLSKKNYESLRLLIRTLLRQRYRSPFDRMPRDPDSKDISCPKEMPEHISTFDVCGEFSFVDMICLNNYDAERLKNELRELSSRAPLSSTLTSIYEDLCNPALLLGRIPYDRITYSPGIRPYQRLRMLDEVMVEAEEALDINEIHRRMMQKAEQYGIDFSTLWRSWTPTVTQEDIRAIQKKYENDFQALAEMIAIDPRHVMGIKRERVYDLKIKGRRKYRNSEFSAFKFVMTATEAEDVYKETRQFTKIYNEPLSNFTMLYAIVIYGDNHLKNCTVPDSVRMKYAGYSLFDYYPDGEADILRKTEEIIRSKQHLALRKDEGEWDIYIPLELRRDRDTWRLIVFDKSQDSFDSLSLNILRKGIALLDEKVRFDYYPECLIGTSAPRSAFPLKITIETDYAISRKLINDSRCRSNIIHVVKKRVDNTMSEWNREEVDFYKDENAIYAITFEVYPNMDFYKELCHYSKSGYLKVVSPRRCVLEFEKFLEKEDIYNAI